MIEKIENNKKTLAIIIKSNYSKNGIEFLTPSQFSQQLAYMKRPTGYEIAPHIHQKNTKKINITQEVLFIKHGKVRVDFYDDNQTYLESRIIEKGDVILLASGGHGFKILEEAEIIEVKQGPYDDKKDKIRFDTTSETNIKINSK